MTGNSGRYIEKMRDAETQLSKESIKKINKLLENESPEPLVKVLEHFVALLRNKPNSQPVDVELFMKDHAKLLAKMLRTQTNSCSLSIVRPAKEVISQYAAAFDNQIQGEAKLDEFKVFVEWSLNFCDAAEIDLKKDDIANSIRLLRKEKEDAEREIQNILTKERDA